MAVTACRSRRSSVGPSSEVFNSWIHPCTAISCMSEALITPACSGASLRLQAGKKKVAGMFSSSSRRTTRGSATRDPYSPCDRGPMLGVPVRSPWIVSLSTSKESRTATRAPPGHESGLRSRPARTSFTMERTYPSDQFHGSAGSGVTCPGASGTWQATALRQRTMGARSNVLVDGGDVVFCFIERLRIGLPSG